MEKSLPNNIGKHQDRKFTFGSSSIGSDSQPMVEVPYRRPPDNGEGSRYLEPAKEAISSASLGRIGVANSRMEGHGFQGHDGSTHRELPNIEAFSDPSPNLEVRSANMLQRGHHRNPKIHGGVEAKLGGFQGPLEEAEMEYDRGNNIVARPD